MVDTVSEEPAASRQEFSSERCLAARHLILSDVILDFSTNIVALFLYIHPVILNLIMIGSCDITSVQRLFFCFD
jgi:hypothetical protein